MCVCVCGSVTLRNVIIGLTEPGIIGMQKHVISSYVHSENISTPINLRKGKSRHV